MGLKAYENSHDPGKRFPGQVLLKPQSKLKQFNISYKEGPAVIRPWGDITVDENGNVSMAPWRDQQGNFGTSWFVQDDICQGWGKDFRFTCFTRCEDEQNWQTGSPLQLLFDEVKYSDRWKHLTERKDGKFAPISAPKHCGFIKGMLIAANGKEYHDKPWWGTICVIAPSAREAFDELLNAKAATSPAGAFDSDPFGWNAQYAVGDPIGFNSGKVFEFGKESYIRGGQKTSINVASDARPGSKSGGRDIEIYACRIYPDTPVLPLDPVKVRRYDESFSQALWFMSGEEQINNLIIRGFGHSCRDLLVYTFGGKGVLPASYETGKATVDMRPQPKAEAVTAPTVPTVPTVPAPVVNTKINLDADNPPWEDEDGAPNASAEPASAPPVQSPATVAAMSTADSIRARLAAASKKV